MRKEEFEKRAGQPVSDADYRIIDKVYQYHPAVSESSGKDEVAELYKSFGMVIFYDMFPRAEKNCSLKKRLRRTQEEVKQIMEEMAELYESSIREVKAVSGGLKRYEIKEMLELMDETLTGYLSDPHVTLACKARVKKCMERHINDIYKNHAVGS